MEDKSKKIKNDNILKYSGTEIYKRLALFGMSCSSDKSIRDEAAKLIKEKEINGDATIDLLCELSGSDIQCEMVGCEIVSGSSELSFIGTSFLSRLDDTYYDRTKKQFIQRCAKLYRGINKKKFEQFKTPKNQEKHEYVLENYILAGITKENKKIRSVNRFSAVCTAIALGECINELNNICENKISKDNIITAMNLAISSDLTYKWLMWVCEHAYKMDNDEKYRKKCESNEAEYMAENRKALLYTSISNALLDEGECTGNDINKYEIVYNKEYNDILKKRMSHIMFKKYVDISSEHIVETSKLFKEAGFSGVEPIKKAEAKKMVSRIIERDYIERLQETVTHQNAIISLRGGESAYERVLANIELDNKKMSKDVKKKTDKIADLRDEIEKIKHAHKDDTERIREKSLRISEEKYRQQIEKLNNTISEKNKAMTALEHINQTNLRRIQELENELDITGQELQEYQDEYEKLEEATRDYVPKDKSVLPYEEIKNDIIRLMGNRRLFVAGGTDSWRETVVEGFNRSLERSVTSFNLDDIVPGDVVILQIQHMKHCKSVPILNKCRKLHLLYITVTQTNIGIVMNKLLAELNAEITGRGGVHYV